MATSMVPALNGICPYFTMFPLQFPLEILSTYAGPGQWVLDPFCGRGTTNLAARLLGLPSVGIDSSPVAAAVAQAKLAHVMPAEIIAAARAALDRVGQAADVPEGEFWSWAFDSQVLQTLCRLRDALREECVSDAQKALRGIILGALHGPRPKTKDSYFSNQAQRTYAPKPAYAVRFWKAKELTPPKVSVLKIIEERAQRYFARPLPAGIGTVLQGDARDPAVLAVALGCQRASWTITSPPYYGLRTYIPDQWLRAWFLGGPPHVDYSASGQISHASVAAFRQELMAVWRNVRAISCPEARLIVRFGSIRDRQIDPLPVLVTSIEEAGWRVETIRSAGSAQDGKRQAAHFKGANRAPLEEHDIWAIART